MNETAKKNVVEEWLEAETAEAHDCPVASALNSATKSMKLDEGAVLKKFRELYQEPPPPAPKADVPD